jgi:preprotein translocase subunit SecE
MAKDIKELSEDEKLKQLDDVAAYEAELAEEKTEKDAAREKASAPRAVAARKKEKGKKAPGRFKRFFLAIGRRFKETFAELKKVSWPSFPKVMKQTSIVVGVVLFFLVIVFGFDLGLSQLYQLLFPAA